MIIAVVKRRNLRIVCRLQLLCTMRMLIQSFVSFVKSQYTIILVKTFKETLQKFIDNKYCVENIFLR